MQAAEHRRRVTNDDARMEEIQARFAADGRKLVIRQMGGEAAPEDYLAEIDPPPYGVPTYIGGPTSLAAAEKALEAYERRPGARGKQ